MIVSCSACGGQTFLASCEPDPVHTTDTSTITLTCLTCLRELPISADWDQMISIPS